jgi:hypothetical protein
MSGPIDELHERSAKLSTEMAPKGIRVDLLKSPEDFQKQSLTVILDSHERLAQITVWETGEAELEFAQVSSAEILQEHQEIAGSADLQESLNRLSAWVSGSDSHP